MRQGTSNRRSRNRNNNNRRGGNNRAQVFDSNGPDVRIRGTAHQICEKYVALAKDARSAGDTVMAESYLQHAEHYQRIISVWNEQRAAQPSGDKSDDKTYDADGNKKANGLDTGKEKDDLSLPSSILGAEVKSKSESVRTGEGVLEDA